MGIDRRWFVLAGLGAAFIAATRGFGRAAEKKNKLKEEISAPEDLMREHGVLNRILLVYEEGVRRLRAESNVSPDVFQKSAVVLRNFVENYHEKLEEQFIFPQFEKRKEMLDLVSVLRRQHEAGRKITDAILRIATAEQFRKADARQQLIQSCDSFIRMYLPHEAREDTVLFPALYKVVGAKEVRELGERFEKEEHRLFGEGGFDKTVAEVAAIEKELSIYDLASFTPK